MAECRPGGVAIVDDDPAVLDSLKFLLEVTGHTVETYSSGDDFLHNRGARPACLILDQHMPHMTGLELTARLRIAGETLPVLLITGSSSAAIVSRAAQLGVEKVLEKPLNEDTLLQFVDAHH